MKKQDKEYTREVDLIQKKMLENHTMMTFREAARRFYIRVRQPKDEEQVAQEQMLHQLEYKNYKDDKIIEFYERWILLKDKTTTYGRYSKSDYRDLLWRKLKDADTKLLTLDLEKYKRNRAPSELEHATTCTLEFLERAFILASRTTRNSLSLITP